MDETTFAAMKTAADKFHPIAMQIPGVHGTSIGLKETDGAATKTFAIRVHLSRKRPEDSLAPSEILPKSFDGFPIDVVEHEPPGNFEDSGKYRPVEGGFRFSAEHYTAHWTVLPGTKRRIITVL